MAYFQKHPADQKHIPRFLRRMETEETLLSEEEMEEEEREDRLRLIGLIVDFLLSVAGVIVILLLLTLLLSLGRWVLEDLTTSFDLWQVK